jgi:rod shape-determining protein MreD
VDPSPLQRVDTIARQWVPFSATLLLMLFGLTPSYLPAFSPVAPMYTVIAIYFWAVYRPDGLGYGSAFAIGVLEDLLSGTPLGCTALVLMLGQWVVFHQQKFFNGRPFHVVWAAFLLVALGSAAVRWLMIGMFLPAGFVGPTHALASGAMTVAVYPVVGWVLAKMQLRLMSQP